ncbi:acyl-homoserine-lactone synthase [Rhizobium sp. S163]|uniref:acyl-homoserine-lactone synthase n=1 Tax=Rhizobium sp. S163 TaxID=3055039 RepID=UPI0025A9ADC7|nr:acyl-homoserine-lactone synthase [Rhizobium sp. S163]MDM9649219.1 acyl-homoserine-lactone synthase [Rhizobium sp. S163]
MEVIDICMPETSTEAALLDEMHRLRAKVFQGRLGWDVACQDGREFDQFDDCGPTYILVLDERAGVVGSVRLLPMSGPNMLMGAFRQLLEEGQLATNPTMIESSRFCVDTSTQSSQRGATHEATFCLLAGIIEWCLRNGWTDLVTATDVRMERLLRQRGWPITRLGEPCLINETNSVAGRLAINRDTFDLLRPMSYRSRLSPTTRKAA